MARQNGKEHSYPRNRQGQVCVGVYGRCCGSIVATEFGEARKRAKAGGVGSRTMVYNSSSFFLIEGGS